MDYLRKYLNEVSKFDSNVWSLIYDNKLFEKYNEINSSYQVREAPNQKITPLILDFIERNKLLDSFLSNVVILEPYEEKLVGIIAAPITVVFGNMDVFEVFLKAQSNNKGSKYISEFIEFYNAIKISGFKYIDFTFNAIPRPAKRK
jgi:hypothetical protein